MSSYRGNLMDIAEAVRQRGRGGDEVLIHVNPEEFMQMQELWGEPSINPHTGLPEYGFFSKLKKALGFEVFNTKSIWDKIRKNPERLLVGAVDPLGTKIANEMYGQDWDPAVNQLGGATEQTYREAEARGMDTGLARDLHNAAGLVAGFYGAQGLGNLASAGISNLSQPAAQAIGTGSATTGAGSGLGQAASSTAGMTAEGLVPISTAAIDTMAAPVVQGGSTGLAGLGTKAADWGSKAWNYAKQPENWATIAQGVQTAGSVLNNLVGGEEGPPGPPAPDPGYELNVRHPTRQYNAPDFSRYYNYGEGPEHSYYTYGPMPEDLEETGYAPPPRLGLAEGGQPMHLSGLESPLSSTARYMQDGPGSGRGDEIDAKLSPKEYVFDAETVALLGDGNPDHGAKMLDDMRQRIRKHKGKALAKGKFSPAAKKPEGYL